jgi:hypothetical protein
MNPTSLPEWTQSIIRLIADIATWLADYQAPLALLISALALFKSFQRKTPQLELGLERIDDLVGDESSVILRLTNVGERAASDVQVTWVQQSRCTMRPVPQPFTLPAVDHRLFEFTVRPIELIMRIGRADDARRLGFVVVTYGGGGWRRRRVGRSLMMAERKAGSAPSPITLTRLPRPRLRDLIPAFRRMADARAERDHARRFAEWLTSSKAYLVARGIPVVPQEKDDDVFRRLLGELGSRGWAWEYESGDGYMIKAEKLWLPSSSWTIRYIAETREDVAALVLAAAMQQDAEQSPQIAESAPGSATHR